MKLGVITDIHNNITALKAIVEKLKQMECDKIICCGDIIGIGPCPEETVQYFMQIPNLIAVRGNHEKYLLEGMPTEYPNEENMGLEEMKHHQWEHHLLSAKSIDFLESLPYKINVSYEGFNISIMHYCMDRDGHYIYYKANPSEDDLKNMFADVSSDVILYGHNHCRNICKADKLYINVGSLGCPAQDKNLARAGILKLENGNAEVQTIDVEYDVDTVIQLIDKINYPDSDNIKKYFYGIW
ncbi:MAG: metallophosphatase family protein [Eubacterium sp.]|nr:metallophosphatase family protein [Eubacterium sp.]